MNLQKLKVGNDWDDTLEIEFNKDYFINIIKYLQGEYNTYNVYPDKLNILNALRQTPLSKVKVVILGQDPYHECGQAEGLAFSVPVGCPIPPSLQNIFKELYSDLNIMPSKHGNLLSWTKQGVLLLNTVLTVREGVANSHKGIGWEIFTDTIIKTLSAEDRPIVFILWGNNAKSKIDLIDTNKHHIIKSPHPSPLSAYYGFFGSKPFSKANGFLENPIDWEIR